MDPFNVSDSSIPIKRDQDVQPTPENVPALVTRYISQIVNGCGSKQCTATLCRDGIRNTSRGRPGRKYTTRSARTIAIALVAAPNPRRYLCPEIADGSTRARGIVQETRDPPDPSALDQLLAETRGLQILDDPDLRCTHDEGLAIRHSRISELVRSATLSASGSLPDTELVDEVIPHLDWLLAKTPCESEPLFEYVNDIISKGSSYPSKKSSDHLCHVHANEWTATLDTLHHKPFLRLLSRIVQVLGERYRLKSQAYVKFGSCETQPSIYELLVKRILGPQGTVSKARALLIWSKKLTVEHWDAQPTVKVGTVCHAAWGILQALCTAEGAHVSSIERQLFIMPMITLHLSTVQLSQSFVPYEVGHETCHILNYSCLFDISELILLFRVSNHLTMRSSHSRVHRSTSLRERYESIIGHYGAEQWKHATNNYLLLSVSRGNILQDTFDQLWQRRKDELKRPLRVRLGEMDEHEMGQDLGGVQIEFFNLVMKQIFREEADMFVTDAQTAISNFKAGSLQPLHMFEMVGMLLALAIYNGITLPINMPNIFYELLFSPKGRSARQAIESIRQDWPMLAKSMQSVLHEDVPGLEMTFPFEANGIRMEVEHPLLAGPKLFEAERREGRHVLRVTSTTPEIDVDSISKELPGWRLVEELREPTEVDKPELKELYVVMYIRWAVYWSVAPQWEAFKRGFLDSEILNRQHLQALFLPAQLKQVIEGTTHLDISWLRSITQYDGFNQNDPYIQQFWRVVTAWSEAKQKQLVKFVTAAERIPITGKLTFIVQKLETENLERLPTSSTCFGTLSLPVYGNESVLDRKLSLALELGTEGFGVG